MASVFATTLYPVPKRFINWGKETTAGTPVAGTYTFPMDKFTPTDKPERYIDTAWRAAMAGNYNMIDGVHSADLTMGGPLFLDGIGYPILSICGDYWQSVTGTAGTATTLATASVVGATSLSLTSGTGFSTGTIFSIDTGTAMEVRKVTTVSTNTITFTPGLYQAHASAAAVTPYTATTSYTHNFALLNSGAGGGGFDVAQPPTYTLVDASGVPATSGARQYGYTVLTELGITGVSNKLLEWDAKAMALYSSIPGTAPTATISTVPPQASWDTTITIAGTQINTFEQFKLTMTRKTAPLWTQSGQQDFYALPRGAFTAAIEFTEDPATSETTFLDFWNNTQPTLVIVCTNSTYGNITITANQLGFDAGQLTDSKDVFGMTEGTQLIANTTNVGPSGGFSPLTIAVTNSVVAY